MVAGGNAVLWLWYLMGVGGGLWAARGQDLGYGGTDAVPIPSPGRWPGTRGWEAFLPGGAGLAQGGSSALLELT